MGGGYGSMGSQGGWGLGANGMPRSHAHGPSHSNARGLPHSNSRGLPHSNARGLPHSNAPRPTWVVQPGPGRDALPNLGPRVLQQAPPVVPFQLFHSVGVHQSPLHRHGPVVVMQSFAAQMRCETQYPSSLTQGMPGPVGVPHPTAACALFVGGV